jgi:hypothetical protein
MPYGFKSRSIEEMEAAAIEAVLSSPCPDLLFHSVVPVPFPNFTNFTLPQAVASFINIDVAQTHGLSLRGAEEMYLENRVPTEMTDKFVLARLTEGPGSSPTPTIGSSVLLDLITPAADEPAAASESATPASTAAPTAPSGVGE